MNFNLKKGKLITVLDIALIIVVFLFAKSYLQKFNKNSTSITKDKIKYTLLINNEKIKYDELLNIRIKIENKDRKKKELQFNNSVPFNYIIEKNGQFVYKRDILESINIKPKKIYLNKYSKTEFGTEWYGIDMNNKNVEAGKYTLRVYSKDLNIELMLNFEIIQEEK